MALVIGTYSGQLQKNFPQISADFIADYADLRDL
jgi:hypothetical protein